MKNFTLIPTIVTSIFLLFSVVSNAQVAGVEGKEKPTVTESPAKAVKHVPSENLKGTAKGKTQKSNSSNERIYPQNISNQTINLNTQKIHPDLIRSEKIINQEIKVLKNAIKKNKSDESYLKELKKQLITLKSTKKYLKKNNLN